MAKQYDNENGNPVKKKHSIIKWVGIGVGVLFVLGIIGMVFGDDNQGMQSEQPVANQEQTTEQPQEQQQSIVDDKGNLIMPNTIEGMSGIYEIKDMRMGTADYTGSPIVVIEMDYTNKGDQPMSPWMSFVADVDATQNNGTTTETLNGANGQMSTENADAVAMGDANVNPGKKVHAIIGYQLTNNDLPVFFKMRSDIQGRGFYFNNK